MRPCYRKPSSKSKIAFGGQCNSHSKLLSKLRFFWFHQKNEAARGFLKFRFSPISAGRESRNGVTLRRELHTPGNRWAARKSFCIRPSKRGGQLRAAREGARPWTPAPFLASQILFSRIFKTRGTLLFSVPVTESQVPKVNRLRRKSNLHSKLQCKLHSLFFVQKKSEDLRIPGIAQNIASTRISNP